MSKLVGERLPREVFAAFDGTDLETKVGAAYLLCTVDPDSFPRYSMLSAGEILAVNDRTMRFAFWPGTQTALNIRSGRPATLSFVASGIVFYVQGIGHGLPSIPNLDLERVEVTVLRVESDMHPGLPVTDGIRFACEGIDATTLVSEWKTKLSSLSRSDEQGES